MPRPSTPPRPRWSWPGSSAFLGTGSSSRACGWAAPSAARRCRPTPSPRSQRWEPGRRAGWRGSARDETNTTHYGQELGDNRLLRIWEELKASSEFDRRRAEVRRSNAQSRHTRRGLAITPVKFGIAFTQTHLNKAGAMVLIYQDGSV